MHPVCTLLRPRERWQRPGEPTQQRRSILIVKLRVKCRWPLAGARRLLCGITGLQLVVWRRSSGRQRRQLPARLDELPQQPTRPQNRHVIAKLSRGNRHGSAPGRKVSWLLPQAGCTKRLSNFLLPCLPRQPLVGLQLLSRFKTQTRSIKYYYRDVFVSGCCDGAKICSEDDRMGFAAGMIQQCITRPDQFQAKQELCEH